LVRLRVRVGEASIGAAGMGRQTVVVSQGLVAAVEDGSLPVDQAAAVIAHAAGLVRGGWVRHDPVLGFWTLPWQLVRGVAQAIAAGGRRLPLTTVAWRLRGVVIGIAAIQSAQAHQVGLALLIAGIGVISYAMPVWDRHWQRALLDAGDRAVREAGLAAAMAAFLRRCPSTAGSRARVRALEPSTAPTRQKYSACTRAKAAFCRAPMQTLLSGTRRAKSPMAWHTASSAQITISTRDGS